MKIKEPDLLSSLYGSYGQVFFSDNRLFALFLIASSFIDPSVGLSGMVSAVFSILLAKSLGLNSTYIKNGGYSFNALLTGLAMGAYFNFTGNFFLVLLIASSVTLLITVWLSAVTNQYKLPFLSLPFIFTVWIFFLNSASFGNLLEVRNFKDLSSGFFGPCSLQVEHFLGSGLLAAYFKSMAAVFFQNHIISGIIIAAGLLIFSRIAFLLSVTGFLSGYLYFRFVQGNLNIQDYSLVSFNYILSALGLGGFFLIASGRSFLLVILSAPVIGLFITAFSKLILMYSLPLYSLPFSATVIIIVTLLNNRTAATGLRLVHFQQFSPEKNLYAFHTFMERFKNKSAVRIHLPFFGEWTVSQGHDGSQTHKSDWRYAWDFVVADEHKRTFKLPGKKAADFYCYGLPVLCPADGTVSTIEDGIEDNEIGDVNLSQNWGNTIIIKHADNFYSKLSHLKKNSISVKQGDTIKKGEMIALCGNSGRSPEPHIHFQFQASEYIGAPTINYPIGYYVTKANDQYEFRFFDVPKEGEAVIRPVSTPLLAKAFHFVPGMKFNFEINEGGKNYSESWEVLTDPYNNSYIHCSSSNTFAYFTCDDSLFYFTGFKGRKNSLLYYFYLAAYKVFLSNFKNLEVKDKLSIEDAQNRGVKILQDIVAPFYIFIRPEYTASITEINEKQSLEALKIISQAQSKLFFGGVINFELEVYDNKLQQIKIIKKNRCIIAKNIY